MLRGGTEEKAYYSFHIQYPRYVSDTRIIFLNGFELIDNMNYRLFLLTQSNQLIE